MAKTKADHTRHIAVYVRVSTGRQDTASQEPEIERWLSAYAGDTPVRWYRDKASGKTMDRPAWNKLQSAVATGAVSTIVCWRLDRLGRTAAGLTTLFADLRTRRINLKSVREGFDLGTPAATLFLTLLAGIAEYENEVRGERVRAGIAAARAAGVVCGGGKAGRVIKVTPEKRQAILRLHAAGTPKAIIARQVGLSRPTVYAVLAAAE